MQNALSTYDDLELLYVRTFGEFRGISHSQLWEATTAKQMKIDTECTLQNCVPPCIDLPKISD